MSDLPQRIRRRIAQGIVLVAVLATVPWAVSEIAPSSARFVPPFAISLLVAITVVDGLLLWCPIWFFGKLFPGQPIPASLPLSGRTRRGHQAAVWISGVVAAVLLFRWFQSLV